MINYWDELDKKLIEIKEIELLIEDMTKNGGKLYKLRELTDEYNACLDDNRRVELLGEMEKIRISIKDIGTKSIKQVYRDRLELIREARNILSKLGKSEVI